MAIALVSSVSATPGIDGGTTGSIDTTGADLLVMSVSYFSTVTSPVSDSKSNTWSELTRQVGGTSVHQQWYVANPTVGTGHTFTFSDSGSYPAIMVFAFSGVATTTPLDTETGDGGSSGTSLQPGSITPAEDNSLLLTGLCIHGGFSALSINASFTKTFDIANVSAYNLGAGGGYLVQGTAAAVNPTWSWTTSRANSCRMAAFKEAAVGTATPKGVFDNPFAGPFGGPI